MAEATRAGEAPPRCGLPDEIAIWEILARLPPKAILRCGTVCRAWRCATSSRGFLLAHHAHQPALPLLYLHDTTDDSNQYLDIVPLDHRAGVVTAEQLRPVARLGSRYNYMHLEASCEGVLVLATVGDPYFAPALYFSICNPATRQYAPLSFLRGFSLAGMYPHPPTNGYQLLLYPDVMWHERPPGVHRDACYVYAVGSCQPPRHIGWPEAEELIHGLVSVLCRGNLHWYVQMVESENSIIMVFDATAELFRQMRAPVPNPGAADLFEMDRMLGMASFDDPVTTIHIWMTQDYDSEICGPSNAGLNCPLLSSPRGLDLVST